jgi:plastocyanin
VAGPLSLRRLTVLCLLLVAALAALAVGPDVALAANNTTSGPTLESGERTDDAEIGITIADDNDVDESTISADDFTLSNGSISDIIIAESGSDVWVRLSLEERLAVDTTNVSIADGGQIADAGGNVTTTGSVTVTGMDAVGPTLKSGERVNVTQMAIHFGGSDIDESTVTAGDFEVSHGSIADINTSEAANGTVILSLAQRIDTDIVTVGIANGGKISDTDGNELTNGSVDVTGMDSFYPGLESFDVTWENKTSARIRVVANEELAEIRVEISGPSDTVLTRDDFTNVNPRDFAAPYEHTHTFPTDGTYRVLLVRGTDRGGNVVNFSRARLLTRDVGTPEAAIEGQRHINQGDRARFDGGKSTDNIGIEAYNWSIDGDSVGSGETFEHAFDEPGTYEVTLEVSDSRNNVDNTTHTVTVHEAPTKDGVTVAGNQSDAVTATVSGGRDAAAVRVTDAYGRLAVSDEVTLTELRPTLGANEAATIDIVTTSVPGEFAGATNATGIGSFEVTPNRSLDETTVRFSVPPSRLSDAGLSFADPKLYHNEGGWEALDTEVVRATNRHVVYEATAPGFSTVVVGGEPSLKPPQTTTQPSGTADIEVQSANLLAAEARFGEPALVSANVRNTGNASGTSTIGVTAGPDVVATRPVTIPANETRTVELSFNASENATIAVNGSRAGDLVVTDVPTPAETSTEATEAGNSSSGGLVPSVPVPNPLALWPDGIIGTALAGLIGFVVVVFLVLKTVAWYLGY